MGTQAEVIAVLTVGAERSEQILFAQASKEGTEILALLAEGFGNG